MAKLCGQKIPPTQKSVGEVMSLKLVADQSAGGFSATYGLKTCGGIFTGRSGTINNELKNQYHKGRDFKVIIEQNCDKKPCNTDCTKNIDVPSIML